MQISGHTRLIAHLGFPTESFKAPMIYNPWLENQGVDTKVVPMGVKPEDYASLIPALFSLTNIVGALVTMPHKIATCAMMTRLSPAAAIAGACNAIRREADGSLTGEMFDGDGFVRGIQRKGFQTTGARALVVGSGGVGSAIAASLAAAGVSALTLYDPRTDAVRALATRLQSHYPRLKLTLMENNPAGHHLVVNATPLGMNLNDPLPLPAEQLTADMFVGEVVMKQAMTPFLTAAKARGCTIQQGTDMLFEMIPAYLDFFHLPVATPEQLRALAQLDG